MLIFLYGTVSVNRQKSISIKGIGHTFTTTAGINDVSDKLKEIDFKAIEETYQSFVSTAEDTIEQLKNDTEGINELIDQTMDTMKEADSVFESISKVDFSSLSEGIKKFNEVIEPLSRLFGSFGR